MNRMVYNPQTGIYEQSNEFPDMYNSNPRFNDSDSESEDSYGNKKYGNRCIGGNTAFHPGYKGYNTSLGNTELKASIRLQQDAIKMRENRQRDEHERYKAKEANTAANARICASNLKKSAQWAELNEQVKADKMLNKGRR